MYRIVTQVSGYVSYREVHANTHPYQRESPVWDHERGKASNTMEMME